MGAGPYRLAGHFADLLTQLRFGAGVGQPRVPEVVLHVERRVGDPDRVSEPEWHELHPPPHLRKHGDGCVERFADALETERFVDCSSNTAILSVCWGSTGSSRIKVASLPDSRIVKSGC